MHFFNPVHAMPLVEVIRGRQTSDDTINRAVAYALSLQKQPVVVNDCAGFFVNRLLFAYFAGSSDSCRTVRITKTSIGRWSSGDGPWAQLIWPMSSDSIPCSTATTF